MVNGNMENDNSTQNIRLILHIGAGKTGTSSIQGTLNKNIKILNEQGIEYLGLMLEKVEKKLYAWQSASEIETFHCLPQKDIDKSLIHIFREIIEVAKLNNIHTLIWSNESFFSRCEKLFPALKHMETEGLDVEFVAYVRRHDSWARSAYVQWALKHKTTPGELVNFDTWVTKRKPNFYPPLKAILNIFPNQLKIRNMDAIKDVVADFLSLCNIDTSKLKLVRSNESPGNEELLLRALFNSQYEGEVLPRVFDEAISSKLHFNTSASNYLRDLLPSKENLEEIMEETKEDRILLNGLLRSQNNEEIKESKNFVKSVDIDYEVLILSLSEIIMEQAKRIDKIEKRLMKEVNVHDI